MPQFEEVVETLLFYSTEGVDPLILAKQKVWDAKDGLVMLGEFIPPLFSIITIDEGVLYSFLLFVIEEAHMTYIYSPRVKILASREPTISHKA